MKTTYLFPHTYKKWAWMVFIPSVIFGIYVLISDYEPSFFNVELPSFFVGGDVIFKGGRVNNLLNEILAVLSIVSGLIVAFSKAQNEDEYVQKLRLQSLVWAVYVNYIVLMLTFIFVYGFAFLWIMSFNMFTILLFFILHFNWKLRQFQKSLTNEEYD